ncbi:hypothetical protein [Streptomyces sp. 135]|uniref:hypothetical protein n=1 Tax=Streptomyces sp. 135 TaxID=2838850 RepID=UPI001CC0E3E7|nr:hypothetical protein [Streptomyces sp. 135]
MAMTDYFAERGWNRADVLRILAEPLEHKLIKVKGWRFGGCGNRTNAPDIPHQRLTEALRTDAESATPDEAVRAREYADDLAAAVDSQDADRTARVLGRINTLLSTATAAFTLTRELLPPGS